MVARRALCAGVDQIDGGTGNDIRIADMSTATATIPIDLNSAQSSFLGTGFARKAEAANQLRTGTGADWITTHASGAMDAIIRTGGGNDMVTVAMGGTDQVIGEGGADPLNLTDTLAGGVRVRNLVDAGGGGGSGNFDGLGANNTDVTGIEHFSFTDLGGGNDIITTGQGNDTLNGRTGADRLLGGAANALHSVDQLADVIIESAERGTADRIAAGASDVLAGGVGIEIMTTTSSGEVGKISLIGNALAQRIFGNAGADVLNDGGFGAADTLTGAGGNDTCIVSNAGTIIVEGAGQGVHDHVAASVSFALATDDNIERLTTTSVGTTSSINPPALHWRKPSPPTPGPTC